MPIDRLPPKYIPFAKKVRRWMLTDAIPMLILGTVSITLGSHYVVRAPRDPLHPIEGFAYLHVLGWMWLVVGIVLVVSSAFPRSKLSSLALSCGVVLCIVWAGSLATQFIVVDPTGGALYRSAQYLAIAAMVVYSVWLKSVLARRDKELMPTEEEVEDALRRFEP